MDKTLTVLSLGFGVQSFCLAAMSALGELPLLDYAVHADTGYEMTWTYEFAARWTAWLESRDIKVRTVQARPDRRLLIAREGVQIPAPLVGVRGNGVLQRRCTDDWKLQPIRRFIRANAKTAEMWLGISTDEVERSRVSDVSYITHAYPLLDKRMNRGDCMAWLERHDLEVPRKSSCYLCPFHRHQDWMTIKHVGNGDWQKAVITDEQIRHAVKGFTCYLHQSRRPLADVCSEDLGVQLSLIQEECMGMCWT